MADVDDVPISQYKSWLRSFPTPVTPDSDDSLDFWYDSTKQSSQVVVNLQFYIVKFLLSNASSSFKVFSSNSTASLLMPLNW